MSAAEPRTPTAPLPSVEPDPAPSLEGPTPPVQPPPPVSRSRAVTLLRQVLILLAGLAAAAVMVVAGIWQLDVYHSQGRVQSERRAAEPAVPVSAVAQAGQVVVDGYGRSVQVSGRYLPGVQVLVPVEDGGGFRVVSALQLADGDVLPVVRGTVPAASAPAAPTGPTAGTGILLPSEEAAAGALPGGQLSAVRVTTLAQQWPGPLVSGYVTLSAPDATAQGFAPATVELPEGTGRLRNGAYALQWWVFAAFALVLAVRTARDQEVREAADEAGTDGLPVVESATGPAAAPAPKSSLPEHLVGDVTGRRPGQPT